MDLSILEHFRDVFVALALAGSLHGAAAGASPATTPEASWRSLSPVSSSATSAATNDRETHMRYVEQARSELEVARRLLEALPPFEEAPWSQEYVSSLRDILEQAQGRVNESHEQAQGRVNESHDRLVQFAPTLGMHLQLARKDLLEAVPKAKIWIALARAVAPDERLTVPRRLIGPVMTFENDLDLEALMTGAWIRAQDEG